MLYGCDITVDTRMVKSGGIGTYIKAYLPYICRKYDVVQLGEEVICGVPFIKFSAPLFSVSEQIQMRRHIAKIKPKLHFHPNYTIPLLYRGKLVTVIHDVFHLANPQYLPNKLAWIYAHYMLGAAIRRSDAIVTVSHYQQSEIQKYLNIKGKHINVIHNGVHDMYVRQNQFDIDRVLEEYNLPSRYVLYVGNVKPHKNIERLIAAMARVQGISLVVTGEREKFITKATNVDEIVHKHNMDDRIHFTGYIDDDDLPALYSGASVVVFPSLYEGFGFPPLEAMACGTPAIASKCELSDEIYGDAYIQIDPYSIEDIAEKIRFAISGGKDIDEYKQRGLRRARMFKWELAAEKLSNVFDDILS